MYIYIVVRKETERLVCAYRNKEAAEQFIRQYLADISDQYVIKEQYVI